MVKMSIDIPQLSTATVHDQRPVNDTAMSVQVLPYSYSEHALDSCAYSPLPLGQVIPFRLTTVLPYLTCRAYILVVEGSTYSWYCTEYLLLLGCTHNSRR